jgi:ElaB/YqjD/DUF883 family membrane-anchored ribosome-binding protein
MDERRLESIGESAQRSARRVAADAQDIAARAGSYAQERAQEIAGRAGGYVSERTREMGDQLQRFTGRSTDAWMRDARRFVQDHPLQAVALTVALGFVLGKIVARD